MNKELLDEREFELVNIIGAKLGSNQRELSRLMNLSLGMVNILLRRLVSKGFIRIEQLNKKKVEYLLTPKGFSEKMQKCFNYTLKTINSIELINKRLKNALQLVIDRGENKFIILGKSDFSELVRKALENVSKQQCQISSVESLSEIHDNNQFLLICQEDFDKDDRFNFNNSLNLIEELAKDSQVLSEVR